MHGLARNRLNDGDQVLHAMTELARDRAQLLILLDRVIPVSGGAMSASDGRMFASFANLIGNSPSPVASLSVVSENARTEPVMI